MEGTLRFTDLFSVFEKNCKIRTSYMVFYEIIVANFTVNDTTCILMSFLNGKDLRGK